MCIANTHQLSLPLSFSTVLHAVLCPHAKTKRATPRRIAVNERGMRIGESHPGAVLTDHEVDLLLELRDEGYSYSWLASKFEVSKGTVAKICTGQRRCQHAAAWRCAR